MGFSFYLLELAVLDEWEVQERRAQSNDQREKMDGMWILLINSARSRGFDFSSASV